MTDEAHLDSHEDTLRRATDSAAGPFVELGEPCRQRSDEPNAGNRREANRLARRDAGPPRLPESRKGALLVSGLTRYLHF